MKKKLLILAIALLIILSACTLTACGKLIDLLNGNTGTNEDEGEPPTIIGLETIKASNDYLTGFEYAYNSRGTNPMALTFNDSYYLIIHYKNESKYSISSVKVTWKDSNGQATTKEFSRDMFAEGSGSEATYILFQAGDESSFQSESSIVFTINKVFYSSGSKTLPVSWDSEVETRSISVNLRPSFTLTLEYMNADMRYGETAESDSRSITRVYYKTDMKNYITSSDYTGKTSVPTKKGGWVFAGWYTQPNGQGKLFTAESTYDFWCDVTLYAYYERMYDITLEELATPIQHEYRELGTGASKTAPFTTGAVLKNRGKNSSDSVCSNTVLEVPDTVFIEKYSIIEKTRNDGIPYYDVNVTGTEYPVIRLDNGVFKEFNTITTASIGKYITEIGYAAFQQCTKMETLSIPSDSSLKYIGDYAFEHTDHLGHDYPFTLPHSVQYLGLCAFRYSGWGITVNDDSPASGESRLCIPPTWTYIGYKCFANTRFQRVVFKAGCHFDSQITNDEGFNDEDKSGSLTIRPAQNRIGASIFSQCYRLSNVVFETTDGQSDGLNIIPDYCFDAGSWWKESNEDGDFACINYISFGEGLTYIGKRAFNYQVKISELSLPISLEEVDQNAFYNCTSVTNLNFEHVEQKEIDKVGITLALNGKNSHLKILRSAAFCNLTGIDVVYITSAEFALYGNGVFRGCTRLKCIIFNNIQSVDTIPTGFKSGQAGINTEQGPKYSTAKGDAIDEDEVIAAHEMSDFLFGTAEAGENEQTKEDFALTYTSPVRIFCETEFVSALKGDMLKGKTVYGDLKRLKANGGTKSFNDQVFIHPLNNLFDYKYTVGSNEYVVQIAIQEIYKASGGKKTSTILGYSLVYWSARSETIVLPTIEDLATSSTLPIYELAAYAIPTSVVNITIPSCYTRLEHDAFNGCMALRNVDFEDINTLEYIGQYAFFGTSIRSFQGGTSLKVIGNYAFNRCESLVWVDLMNTPILNKYNGRMTKLYQFKYEYELEDYEEDFSNCIGNSAFQGCSALQWVCLPENIMQIQEGTFIRCDSITVFIIPTPKPSDVTDTTSDECFYAYAQPRMIFNDANLKRMNFYVASSATEIHQKLLSSEYIYTGRYQLLETAPEHPNVK